MAIAQIFVISLFKAFGGRTNDKQWVNRYHIASDVDVTDPGWTPLIQAMAQREASYHLTDVEYMRATISTWRHEVVYDPKNLKVIELGGTGARTVPSGEQPLTLDLALKCKKIVDYGRSGTLFYRGVLHSGDVSVGAGGDAVLQSPGDTAMLQLISGTVASWATVLQAINGHLVMPPKMGPPGSPDTIGEARGIAAFVASGVSVNRRNHRYFDKAASDDGVGPGT